jgi:prepilin-type N-terminal cleavage/methylation domain-containing protein
MMNLTDKSRGRTYSTAFTLIELLTVISILAILMALTIAGIGFAQNKAAEEKTRAGLEVIKAGLTKYHHEWGEYPVPIDNTGEGREGAVALYQALSDDGDDEVEGGKGISSDGREGSRKLVDLRSKGLVADEGGSGWFLIDGFGNPYHYRVYDKSQELEFRNKGSYDLWSYGDDKKRKDANEAKWIKNW